MIPIASFRRIAAVAAVACISATLSCTDSDEKRAEQALLTADSEQDGVQGLLSLNYEITSQVFKKWKRAQLSLDRVLGRAQSRSLKAAIIGTSPTREAIERSVARIERNERAKKAIEDAGMSPRHYVVATVALFQATRGLDPLTGEAFRGVPAQNVEFARQNQAEIDAAGESGDFQQIADSIARARAEAGGAGWDTTGAVATEVIIDTARPLPPLRSDTTGTRLPPREPLPPSPPRTPTTPPSSPPRTPTTPPPSEPVTRPPPPPDTSPAAEAGDDQL